MRYLYLLPIFVYSITRHTKQAASYVMWHFKQGRKKKNWEVKGVELKELPINKTIATLYLAFLLDVKLLQFKIHPLYVIPNENSTLSSFRRMQLAPYRRRQSLHASDLVWPLHGACTYACFSASVLQQRNIRVARGYFFMQYQNYFYHRLGCVLVLRKVYLLFISDPWHT